MSDPPFNGRGILRRASIIAILTGAGALVRYTFGTADPWTHALEITAYYCALHYLLDGASEPRS